MAKNKKLGRGLMELIEQSREMAQSEAQEKAASGTVSSNVLSTKSSAAAPQTSSAQVEIKSSSTGFQTASPSVRLDSPEDSETFRFDRIREDLNEAAQEVEELQRQIDEISAQKETAAGQTSEIPHKTLIDFLDSETREQQEENGAATNKDSARGTSHTEPNGQAVPSVSGQASKSTSSPAVSQTAKQANSDEADENDQIFNLSVSLVDSNPWQPREVFNQKEINELAASIKTHGLLQPIVVRQHRNRYQLVAGERRFRAAMVLNWTHVPATIIEADDREMAELALIENLQRKDLNAIEKADSFDKYLTENQCSQEELAKRLNMDRSTISNLLRLLVLPQVIQQKVVEEKISQGHARSLLSLASERDMIQMAERIEEEKLSVRQAEEVVREWNKKPVEVRKKGGIRNVPASAAASRKKEKSANILDLERQLQDALDLKVKISADAKGKGKLEIYFSNQEDFSSLMDYFKN